MMKEKEVYEIEQIIVNKKDIGLCIVHLTNGTITYPNGKCKVLQQWEIDSEITLHRHQSLRGMRV